MTERILIVERKSEWPGHFPDVRLVTADDYLTGADYPSRRHLRVVNLCRSYRYGSLGYYCSLLAEARGHRVIPTVRTIQDLSRRSIYSLLTRELDDQVERAISGQGLSSGADRFSLAVFFGRSSCPELQELARQIFEGFRAPILRLVFRYTGSWHIASIKPDRIKSLSSEEEVLFSDALKGYLIKPWRKNGAGRRFRYDLAILHNPQEPLPPSDSTALQHFRDAAKDLGMRAELVRKKDYGRLAEFDALFIRETTAINHHTFRFARRAQNEGMVVIDDPDSILRCTNKVFLEELLRTHRVPVPRTLILRKGQEEQLRETLAFPVILKIPDGSFSRGVFKAENGLQLREICRKLFKDSELILAQEYLYTPFDWRVGVLDRQPLFVCKYMMSAGHWQIYDHKGSGQPETGDFETLAVQQAPPKIVKTALRAANLIGDGFYGVDLKETSSGVFVIEVNDNPNVDADVEDRALGENLYRLVMTSIRQRLDRQRSG